MRYLMTVAYDGTNYNGYQKQPKDITIQALLEEALTKINSNQKVSVHASGRTDSKVHALNQKAHFDLDKKIEISKLKHSLNKLLPNDIYVKKLKIVDDKFHARFDVLKKEYIYKINIGEYSPFDVNYVYQYNDSLDVDKMKQAIKYFLGEHDFSSFTKIDEPKETYIRTIYHASVDIKQDVIEFTFVGNGFLRYMVRNMVGLLIEVGELKKDPEEVLRLFDIKDRAKAGICAPACGLYLSNVWYEEGKYEEKN